MGHKGIEIRRAVPGDGKAIAAISDALWKSTYEGAVSRKFLEARDPDKLTSLVEISLIEGLETVFAAVVRDGGENEGRMVGFASGSRGSADGCDCELSAIYVLEEYQGRGIGALLFEETVRALSAGGCRSMSVWALASGGSRLFYERFGGRPLKRKPVDFGGQALDAVGYFWDDIGKISFADLPEAAGTGARQGPRPGRLPNMPGVPIYRPPRE